MTDGGVLIVDGVTVRFAPAPDGIVRVVADEVDIGSFEPVDNGSGYVARGRDGEALTRPSPWGGRVTARFGSKELAARALLELRRR